MFRRKWTESRNGVFLVVLVAVTAAVVSSSSPAQDTSTAKERAKSVENLKELALACHAYHDVYRELPPAAVLSKDGKPLLSWRVLLLPWVNEGKLFREFKLDQPWDSPHNQKLLARMPAIYAPPRGKAKEPNTTFYQVFVGKDTVFEGPRGCRFQDITDGTSNTLLMVEAGQAVPWTKPADLPYDAKKPLPALGGIFPDGFHFSLADGSVHFCKKRFRENVLRLMITRNDGTVLPALPAGLQDD